MARALTVDPTTGSVHIAECSTILSNGLAESTASTELAEFYRSRIDHENGYTRLSCQGVSFGGEPSGFALGFHLGALTQIHLGISLSDVEPVGGWPTRREIDQEVAFVREELAKQLSRSFRSGQRNSP